MRLLFFVKQRPTFDSQSVESPASFDRSFLSSIRRLPFTSLLLGSFTRRLPSRSLVNSLCADSRYRVDKTIDRVKVVDWLSMDIDPSSKAERERVDSPSLTSAALSPDTEDNVVCQTGSVFRSFVYQMYVNDILRCQSSTVDDDDDLPTLQDDMKQITDQPPT